MQMPDPVAFTVGAMQVRWYGVFACLGVLSGYLIMQWRGRKLGMNPQKLEVVFYAALLVGLIGARITYVLTYQRPLFAENPLILFRIWEGGLVSYGGFIGGTVGVLAAIKLLKLDLWAMGDTFALMMPLGQMFGRMGCLLNGCCHGGIAKEGMFFVEYPGQFGHLVPSQLYQGVINLVIFVIILGLSRKIKVKGRLLGLLLVLYGLGRFLNEFNRGDYAIERKFGNLTPAQVVSVGFFVVGCMILGRLWKSKDVYTDAPLDPPPGDTMQDYDSDDDSETPAAKTSKKASKKTSGKSKRKHA